MKYFRTYLLLVIFLIFWSSVWADIPKQINFQGILKDSLGNPYPDGNYSITFRIYNAASGGNILWQEGQLIAISGGLFNHLLGSAIPIPESVFDDSLRWLGIQVAGNPEITPRRQLVSVPYSYVADFAQNAAKLGGVDESNFVRRAGPDSVVSSSGTAFLGSASGSSSADIIGVSGVGRNSSSGNVFGGIFSTSSLGTGYKYGVYGSGLGNTSSDVYGVYGFGQNSGSGLTYAGYFLTSSAGTGVHYGVAAQCNGASTNSTIGMIATAINTSSGDVYGGRFNASQSGTGLHYGVYGDARSGSTGAAMGIYGIGYGFSSGDAYGGSFTAASSGTGTHYGVYGNASGSSGNPAIAHAGYGDNASTGEAYGGLFVANPSGTGQHFGVYGQASGASSAANQFGFRGYADNISTGAAFGGYFEAGASGTGSHYGVFGLEAAGGDGAAVYASGDFAGSGAKYAVTKTSQGNRLLSVIEAPEVWFEDFGEGQLTNGKAHIELDALFLETVTINASNQMKVFIQLKDDCKGVYVKTQTTGFDVFELQSGTSNASFSYRIVAKRKGYESQRLPQTTLGIDDPNLYPELWQEIEKRHQEAKAQPEIQQ